MSQFFPASCENKHYKSRLKCHCPGKCSRGQKLYGQLIWLKLSTEVGCNEISQKSVWLSSLTSNCVVSAGDWRGEGGGGVSFFFFLWPPKIQPPRGNLWRLTPGVNCVAKWIWPWTLLWSFQFMPVKKIIIIIEISNRLQCRNKNINGASFHHLQPMAELWRNQGGEIGRQHVKAHSCSHFSPCFDHTAPTQTDDGTSQIDHNIGAYVPYSFRTMSRVL